jgi:hypothetical protein
MLLLLLGIRNERDEVLRSHQRHDRQKQGDGERTQQDICLRECPARTDRSGWPDHMDMVHELSPSNGVHRLQTLGETLLTTLPDAGWQPWSSWSDSRH